MDDGFKLLPVLIGLFALSRVYCRAAAECFGAREGGGSNRH